MSANQVIKAIKRHSSFLITSHIGLEGDAIGSELALASLLRKLGKRPYIVNSDKAPSNYNFLPGAKGIRHKLDKRKFQAALVIDCSTRYRTGGVSELIDRNIPIINIDHHMDNGNFGQVNWVDPKVSSTGEMIYRLFKLTQTKLERCDACNIYTAILTDTGSFRHSNTTSDTLRISSELLKFGIQPAKVYARIYENNSAEGIVLVAKIISEISFAANNKIAWIKISQDKFKKIKGKPEIFDKILDFAKSINTVKIVLVFCQQNSRLVKLNLRSKSPINVQKIAKVYGGGGHKFASGCRIKGNLQEVQHSVLRQAKKALLRYTK